MLRAICFSAGALTCKLNPAPAVFSISSSEAPYPPASKSSRSACAPGLCGAVLRGVSQRLDVLQSFDGIDGRLFIDQEG
jgi:hypothetical protein